MAFTATFREGDPTLVGFTTTTNTNAGDVLKTTNANQVVIAHQDIPANTLGAVAVGGGVYIMNCNTNCNAFVKVYWDANTNQFSTNSTNNTPLGFTTENAVVNTRTGVRHQPFYGNPMSTATLEHAATANGQKRPLVPAGQEIYTFLTVPTGGSIASRAIMGLTRPSSHRYRIVPTHGQANSFNQMWVHALNHRKEQRLTHWAMHHGDVIPPPYFLDCMLSEMERVDADILSVVIPIKDNRGVTSTAVRDGVKRTIRRVTVKESLKLPRTFSLADLKWADPDEDALLVNNGLLLVRFQEPWVEEVTFHLIFKNFKRPDGKYQAGMFSEDWMFSEWATERGLRLFATTAVQLDHVGVKDYPNYEEWGDWEEEQGDEPCI